MPPAQTAAPQPGCSRRNKAAAEFYAEQLRTPDARDGAGVPRRARLRPGRGRALRLRLRPARLGRAHQAPAAAAGFSLEELVTGGPVAGGPARPIDRFQGRLLWPIRDIAGDVVGFGARRLFDDDRIEAKYVNTPETPIYKKSQVLYGVDLAKKEIARQRQAVVVEGYTDVMACHLAGVTTAVATCGTAFGDDHIRVLRRLLMDQNEFRGEVMFTFDGDAAGQKAALKAFESDQKFATQTFVAVEPGRHGPVRAAADPTSLGDSGIALLRGSRACSSRSLNAGFSLGSTRCQPRARRREPRTDEGAYAAAPKEKTTSTMVRNNMIASAKAIL